MKGLVMLRSRIGTGFLWGKYVQGSLRRRSLRQKVGNGYNLANGSSCGDLLGYICRNALDGL